MPLTKQGFFVCRSSMKTLKYEGIIGANEDAVTKKALEQYPILTKQATLFGFSRVSEGFIEKVKKLDPDNDLGAIQAAALFYIHIPQL